MLLQQLIYSRADGHPTGAEEHREAAEEVKFMGGKMQEKSSCWLDRAYVRSQQVLNVEKDRA
jgi:hypothetical protein